ncbi:hypothetical protein FHS14_001434 [Paenibacillus baekrokdamisoli]|nr:glycoside hydrolase family 3 C-terminal domain-containing protein [Paenibacillus baekrokdamisoli]MBB3068458.1 hypothetical protein [Paenibacillus baekrokdamisoli]
MAHYPGMEGGTVIAKTSFGDINLGGKLPFVLPKRESDLPQVDWDATQIAYGYYHGYTLLEKEAIEPCLAYGYGLSYTTFELSQPSFVSREEGITACCLLKNTGSLRGDEVVQLYMGFNNSKADRPVKVL